MFKTLVAELYILAHIPKCVFIANSCTCHNIQKPEQYEEGIKLSQFLMELGDQFTATRGYILLMSPTLNQAFSLLLQEVSYRECFSSVHNPLIDTMAMNVKFNHSFRTKNVNFITQMKSYSENTFLCDYNQI